MKVKITQDSQYGSYVDVTMGNIYHVVKQNDKYYEILDDVGDRNDVLKEDCEVIEETFTSQDLEKGTTDFLYNNKAPVFTSFQDLQQYASDLNIDITFLPNKKVMIYIDNTMDKTYTVETEDELKEVVEALRVMVKYLDKH